MDNLVVVRTGLDRHQAALFKSNLEGHGIAAFLENEHIGSLNYVVHTDLLVRSVDKGAAEALLSKVDTIPVSKFPTRLDADGEERACQHCGSMRVHPYVGAVATWVPGFKIQAAPGEGWFHCLECDSYYREQPLGFASLPVALLWSVTLGAVVFGLYFLIQWLRFL